MLVYMEDEIQDSDEERRIYNGGWENLRRVCLITNLSGGDRNFIKVRRVDLQRSSNLTVLKLVGVDLESKVLDVSPLLQLNSLEVHSQTQCYGGFEPCKVDIQGLGLLRNLCVLVWIGIPRYSAGIGEIARLFNLEFMMLVEGEEWDWEGPSLDMSRLSDLRDIPRLWWVSLILDVLPIHLVWSSMANLQHLDLSCGKEMRSCNGVGDMVALVTLDLSGCIDLETLPCLGKLMNLKTLDISKSKVSEVSGLDRLEALQEFYAIDCERLKRLPDMQLLSNLKVFDLEYTTVEPVSGLEGLTALRRLRVCFDTFKDCPSQPQLTNLQKVKIELWGKEGLPCMVGWTSVEELEIKFAYGVCKLEGLENLSSLQRLEIWFCNFRDVSVVSCLTSLQRLTIWDCEELEKVPSLDQLLKLEYRRLYGLGSATWEACGTLPQLNELEVYNMAFQCIPNLSNFPQLKSLKISGCHALTRVTSDGPLAMLETVDISNCSRLESAPSFRESLKLRRVTTWKCPSGKFDFKDAKPPIWTDYLDG